MTGVQITVHELIKKYGKAGMRLVTKSSELSLLKKDKGFFKPLIIKRHPVITLSGEIFLGSKMVVTRLEAEP